MPAVLEGRALRRWRAGERRLAATPSVGGDDPLPDAADHQREYGRWRHTVSLLVFRVDSARWPARGLEPLGVHRASAGRARGFNVLLWRAADLRYALVSDLAPSELRNLGLRLAAEPRRH